MKFDEFKEIRDIERDKIKKMAGVVVLTDLLDESEKLEAVIKLLL